MTTKARAGRSYYWAVSLVILLCAGCGEPQQAEQELWGFFFTVVAESKGVQVLEYENSNERIDVTRAGVPDETAAKAFINDKVAVYRSLFERQRVGYRGQYTEYVECPDKYKPQFFERRIRGGRLRYFTAFANARYVIGVCAAEDIERSVITAYLYCIEEKTIFEIKHFFPAGEHTYADDFLSRLKCP